MICAATPDRLLFCLAASRRSHFKAASSKRTVTLWVWGFIPPILSAVALKPLMHLPHLRTKIILTLFRLTDDPLEFRRPPQLVPQGIAFQTHVPAIVAVDRTLQHPQRQLLLSADKSEAIVKRTSASGSARK